MESYKIVTTIPQEIFRAYDIRGIVAESFTPDNIYTIGLALGSEALARGITTLALGRDGRLSGPELLRALTAGILASGCNIVAVAEVTTPILYYAATIMESHSGIMLSGSHNPANYNGIKIVFAGQALHSEEIQKLYFRIQAQDFRFGSGKVEEVEIIADYIKRIVGDLHLARPLKIAVDCGNGVGGKVAPQLFRALGCEVSELYCEVDGCFPHHQPDPAVPKNLRDLVALVQTQQLDLGLAFDGDADRVGVVTEKGEIITADRLLLLFALDLLTRHPQAAIVFDVKCTKHLITEITKHQGIPIIYKTGHSLIKTKLKESGALLGGEFSGHLFFKERWFGFDDGIYVGARLVELLSQRRESCSEVFAAFPNSVNTPELKIPMAEDKKFQFMERVIQETKFAPGHINLIDGLRVDYADGFGLLRVSNTSPSLIMRFEGDNREALQRIQAKFREQLLQLEPTLKLPF